MIHKPYLSKKLRQRVIRTSGNRCGYCLASQLFFSVRFEIEHIQPLARGGNSCEHNLWLSCPSCNSYKGSKTQGSDPETGKAVPLFNPRQQNWGEHFEWSRDGVRIIGKTAIGRATVVALRLNNDLAVMARRLWVAARRFPPKEGLK